MGKKFPDYKAEIADSNLLSPNTESTLKTKNPQNIFINQALSITDMKKLVSSNISASSSAGESVLSEFGALHDGDIFAAINPIKLIFTQVTHLIKRIVSALKDKKTLIPVIVLSVIWIILNVLQQLRINVFPISLLSFLTFAEGGVSNNIFHIIGGLLGKGIFAYFVSSIIFPLFKKQNPLNNISTSIKNKISNLKNLSSKLTPILIGLSVSLIFYNFLAGHVTPMKSMAAIACGILSLGAIEKSNGFVFRLIQSVLNQIKAIANKRFALQDIMTGISFGFIISIPLSFIPFGYICYLFGVASAVYAVINFSINEGKKEVVQK